MEQRELWSSLLADWHRRQTDTGTHSASGWALRQWFPELPEERAEAHAPSTNDRRWHVNRVGMTMLCCKPGEYQNEQGTTFKVERDFLLSDREVSVELFKQFISDQEYPIHKKPDRWEVDINVSPSDAHPTQQVSWHEAVMFCNWVKESLITLVGRKVYELIWLPNLFCIFIPFLGR